MRTALIRVTAQAGTSGGYRVKLFSDAQGGNWLETPLASGDLPADLGSATAPAALSQEPGQPFAEAVRQFVEANPESAEFEAIGEHLAGLLFQDDLAGMWDQLQDEHLPLRTFLQIEPPELRLLPWELMNRERQLFINPSSVLARVTELVEDRRQDLGPIRLLVVEGERDDDLGTRTEVRAIKYALPGFGGRIEAEFLTEPSAPYLETRYTRFRPHILHFIGHGGRQDNEPALKLIDDGTVWWLTRQYIQNLMRPAPRLAILNACRSGDVDGVRALTDVFLGTKSAAVVGIQGNIRGAAAARFGGEFYRALSRGELVDQAVTTARTAVYAAVGFTKRERDWFLPALTLRVLPEHVLPITYGIPDQEMDLVKSRLFRRVRAFVDRVDERDMIVEWLDPNNSKASTRLVVVTGDLQVGKTALLQWLRTRCALRGRRVRYVDFRGPKKLDFVAALYAIRDTLEDVPSLAVNPDAFDRFNYDLTFLANGRLPEEPSGPVPKVVPPPPDAVLRAGVEKADELIFEWFRAALDATTTADNPLLLILDHIDGLPDLMFQNYLYPQLIKKIVELEPPNVRLVVALSTEQQRDYWPSDEARVGERTEICPIPAERYEELVEDFLLAMGRNTEETQEQRFIQGLAVMFPDAWKPSKLLAIKNLAEV
jgi:hypothetical protein